MNNYPTLIYYTWMVNTAMAIGYWSSFWTPRPVYRDNVIHVDFGRK